MEEKEKEKKKPPHLGLAINSFDEESSMIITYSGVHLTPIISLKIFS